VVLLLVSLYIISIRAVPTGTFAAISPLEMILFGKNLIAFF